jgi:hypothetical protein
VNPGAVLTGSMLLAMPRLPGDDRLTLAVWATRKSACAARLWPPIEAATTSDFLSADTGASTPAGLAIADLIVCPPELATGGFAERLEAILRHYPGCAVAATELRGGECLVRSRGEAAIRFTVHHHGAETCSPALVGGAFAYGWLIAGRPLAALRLARLYAVPRGCPAWPRSRIQDHVMSISFDVRYGPAASESWESSRSRISSASGALIRE